MMTVDRFEITIELMPLLQGQFRITSMRLEQPRIQVVVSDEGRLDWQVRSKASQALDPENVILDRLEIVDGQINYDDRVGETHRSFGGVNAVIEARSLLGPWRAEGSYLDDGVAVPFRFATGRRLDDGTIRLKADLSPAGWPVALAADGVIGNDDDGLYYDGTYNLTEIVTTSPEDPDRDVAGLSSEGKFRLTRRQLAITQAILSEGPPERPFRVAGALTVYLGAKPSFEAHASARQIDLDRSLGSGPAEPVEVSSAVNSLVARLENSFIPPIPGSVFFTVPAVVVSGSVVQDVAIEVRPTIGGWRIVSLDASLPGRATLEARGVLSTDFEVGFAGDIRLAVNQPALFATWLRGKDQGGAGRLLAPFEVAGRADLAPGRFLFEEVDAALGAADIRGRFAWSEAAARQHRRILEAELVADDVDFTQLKAFVELIGGEDFANTTVVADSYDIKLSAGRFQFEDVAMQDVAIDASYADDALTVNQFSIGDLGGANIEVTQGRIEALSGQPQGHLNAQLEAATLEAFSRVVGRFLPENPISVWLQRAGGSLAPAFLTASIEAPAQEGNADVRAVLSGVAAATNISAAVDLSGTLANWRQSEIGVEILIDSPNAAELSRQAGFAVAGDANPGGAHLEIGASGVPIEGLDARIAGEFAGVGLRSHGQLALDAGSPTAYTGSLAAASDDFEPLLAMLGLGIPVAAIGNSARIDGDIALVGKDAQLTLRNSHVAGSLVNGQLALAQSGDNAWMVDGDLHIDSIDVGWVTALGLGFAVLPTGDAGAPWSRAPFGAPGYGDVRGRIAASTDALFIAPGFDASAATLSLTFQPDRIAVDLMESQALGGSLSGGLSIHNVVGNARVAGSIDLKGATLEDLVWSRGGRSVATGVVDLSAEFEAAGRSPAALASSLTGGGAIAIRDGEARYMNPRAARTVIRASDLGQEFSENELRDAVAEQIDGGPFVFNRAEGAFAIAAGVARMKSLVISGNGIEASGDAAIDLSSLTIDSDWTVTFDPGDDEVEGAVPQVGIIFRGPLAAPERIIDVLQFGSYLNIRQEERLLELLSQAEADRQEADRLSREKRKFREDAERRARKVAEAEAARLAAEAESRRQAAETAARRAADEAERVASEAERLRAAADQAVANATQAEAAHEAAIEKSERLAKDVEQLQQAVEEATAKATEAAASRTEADEMLRQARQRESAQRIAAEAAATAAEEAARRQALAEDAAQAATEQLAVRDAARQEAARLAGDTEQARRETDEAAAAAVDLVKTLVGAERQAVATAAEAEQRKQAAQALARDAAAKVQALSEALAADQQAANQAAQVVADAGDRLAAARTAVQAATIEVSRQQAAHERAEEDVTRTLAAANEVLRPTTDVQAGDLQAQQPSTTGQARDVTDEQASELRAAVVRALSVADDAGRILAGAQDALVAAEETAAQAGAEFERLQALEAQASNRVTETIAALGAAEEGAKTAKANVEAINRAAEEAANQAEAAIADRVEAETEVARLNAEAERLAGDVRLATNRVTEAETLFANAQAELADAKAEVERLKRLAEDAAAKAAEEEEALRAAVEETARLADERQRRALIAAEAADAADTAEALHKSKAEEAQLAVAEIERMRLAAEVAVQAAAEAAEAFRLAEEEAARVATKAEEQRLVAEEATRKALEVSVPR